MRKLIFFYIILSFFSGCSPAKSPVNVVNRCNEEQKKCNSIVHKEVCGNQSGSCVEKMITDENWDASDFYKKINQCDENYKQCLNKSN